LSYLSIPRHYIFILQSGEYVVRLADDQVCDIASGQMIAYSIDDFGHAITDGELRKLQHEAYINSFDEQSVHVRADVAAKIDTNKGSANRIRAYYIATTIPEHKLSSVLGLLPKLTITHVIQPEARDGVVAVYGRDGQPFMTLHDAEYVLQQLSLRAPEMFRQAIVSVYEVAHREDLESEVPSNAALRTQTLKQLQSDTSPTQGKTIVIVGGSDPNDQKNYRKILGEELKMQVYICQSSIEAIPIIEDYAPVIVLVDLQLSDIHGWAFIRKLREIPQLANLHILVISNDQNDMVIALKVVKVTGFIHRPINWAQLKEQVWVTLSATQET